MTETETETKAAIPASWEVEAGWYEPDRFYFRMAAGSKTTNVGARISVGLDRTVMEMMQEGISTGAFPYKTVSDFIKDAIIHRMYYLRHHYVSATRRNSLQQSLYREVGLEKMLGHQAAQRQYESTIEQNLFPTIEDYLKRGEDGKSRAVDLIHETLEYIESFTDPFWRAQYREKIIGKYGYLLG